MKLIIDIPEYVYEACLGHRDIVYQYIANGTPYEEQAKGEWIKKVDDVGFVSYICSECGSEIEVEDCSDDKFCFNCGAKMKVADNE